MTCRWAWCSLPATAHTFFCHEHGQRIAHATTALDAERQEADS